VADGRDVPMRTRFGKRWMTVPTGLVVVVITPELLLGCGLESGGGLPGRGGAQAVPAATGGEQSIRTPGSGGANGNPAGSGLATAMGGRAPGSGGNASAEAGTGGVAPTGEILGGASSAGVTGTSSGGVPSTNPGAGGTFSSAGRAVGVGGVPATGGALRSGGMTSESGGTATGGMSSVPASVAGAGAEAGPAVGGLPSAGGNSAGDTHAGGQVGPGAGGALGGESSTSGRGGAAAERCPVEEPTPGDACTEQGLGCDFAGHHCTCAGTWWCDSACPASLPNSATSCTTNTACKYGNSTCLCVNLVGGIWFCDGGTACPAEVPSGTCQDIGIGCTYAGEVCACLDLVASQRWTCTASAACPITQPALGSACQAATVCGYGDVLCGCQGSGQSWYCQ
jgi:hypothetical protein